MSGMDAYNKLCAEAEQDFEGFWARLARENVDWKVPFTKTLNEDNAPFYKWFEDGKLNVSYNCLDRNLTNGNADLVVIGLAHHFELTLNAAALGCAKPDARAYAELADRLTLKPAEILFVGDEPHADVVGPRAAGMQTVWLNRGGVVWPDELPAPDACIRSLEELPHLVG